MPVRAQTLGLDLNLANITSNPAEGENCRYPRDMEGKQRKFKLSLFNLLVIKLNPELKYGGKKSPSMLALGAKERGLAVTDHSQ